MEDSGPRSLGQLLDSSARLRALKSASEDRQRWTKGVRVMLPGDLAPHLVAATREKDELVLIFDSPAWASRANYMKEELLASLDLDDVRTIRIRVKPPGGTQR